MSSITHNRNTFFLKGGGEMGELIRRKDWSTTPIGNPETWPQSLRTTLSIILNSKFPMFLFWGPELICFYNDAYRPSLGNNGKHPDILGGRAKDYWSEIWADIKPFIDQVLAGGEATWSEDQLLPIYRNGKMEDAYWTVSYSAVYDESGKPSGVFVTCTETTKQVESLKSLERVSGIIQDITQNKQAEQVLKQSEERFHTLADNMSQFAWTADETGWIYWYNQRWYDYTGTNLEEMQGWGWQKVHHPDHIDRVVKRLQHSWDTGEIWEDTFPLRGRDGAYRWFLSRAIPIKDEQGKVVRWFGTNTDITEQKTHLEKLQESEKNFRQLSDLMPEKVSRSDANGNIIYYNQNWLDYTGLSYDELKNWGWAKAIHPEDVEELTRLWTYSFTTGNDFEMEFRILNRTGHYRWHLCRSSAIKDREGNIKNWVGVTIDIEQQKSFTHELERQIKERTTELQRANDMLLHKNQQLTSSEEFNRSLTDISPTMIYIHDVEKNKPIFLNNTYLNFVGYTWEEALALDSEFMSTVVHPDDLAVCQEILQKVKDSSAGTIFEANFRRKNLLGEWVPFLNRVTAFKRNSKNEVLQMIGVGHDISQLKKAEGFLEQKNQDLEKMNKELQSFAYISSHDLQEPLRKIQTFSTRIMDKDYNNLSDSGKGYFNRIQDSAHRMRTLINDLLAYSRTNTLERKFEKTHLKDIVEDIKAEFSDELQEKQAIFVAEDLCECKIIPFQLRQLIHNLVGNALKFSNPNRPPHIKITSKIAKGSAFDNDKLEPEKEYCHIRITDNGIGFEQEYSERIFEVFQRLHEREKYPGTGIGLSIVKKIIENHNGFITAKGELDKGTIFDIFIPE